MTTRTATCVATCTATETVRVVGDVSTLHRQYTDSSRTTAHIIGTLPSTLQQQSLDIDYL